MALLLLSLATSRALPAAEALDPRELTARAIADLEAAVVAYPATTTALQPVIDQLELSLTGPDGQTHLSDRCHTRSQEAGVAAFSAARAAVLAINDIPAASLPPFVNSTLLSVRADLITGYTFLAEAALQEVKGLVASPLTNPQVVKSQAAFVVALVDFALGRTGQGMQSLRQAWQHAELARPAPSVVNQHPLVSVVSPTEGGALTSVLADVAGRVQLTTAGTVGPADVTVKVNGKSATVAHRSFQANQVLLHPGVNAVVAVARSTQGGVASSCTAVTVLTTRARVAPESGGTQSGMIGAVLPQPLVARVFAADGQPAAGVPVVFRVVEGNGSLANQLRSQVVTTGADGRASAMFTLGNRVGVGVNRVRAVAAGFPGEAVFSPAATGGPADSLNAVTGDNQSGGVNQPLALPLRVIVTDAGQNPVAGTPVTFEVVAGGGTLGGSTRQTTLTDANGRASAPFTLGAAPGLDAHRVEARFPGLVGPPLLFKASAFVLGDPAVTRVSGVVHDNQSEPVPGVTMRLRGTALTTTTDTQGQFMLTGAPVGHVVLVADATTADRPGTWASLEFEMNLLPGVDNTLEKPIYILPIDEQYGEVVGGSEDVTISHPEIPGLSLTVLAGSATFPDGANTGLVSVTPVHADKIPMAPGAGMQPRIIVTIQPAGAHFDPPAPITFPNVEGLPAGAVTEMFSFDHDLGQFVSIGTGTVSDDGLSIRSDPGFGVVKAGWHCASGQVGNGQAAALFVDITTPGPVLLCAGGNPPASKLIQAVGGPPQDAEYSWAIDNPAVASLNPAGGGLCPNASQCNTTATGGTGGQATATVTILCKTTGQTASDSIGIVSPRLEIVSLSPSSPLKLGEDLLIDYDVILPPGVNLDGAELVVTNQSGTEVFRGGIDASPGGHLTIWPGTWNQAPHNGAFANPKNGPYTLRLVAVLAGSDCGGDTEQVATHLEIEADITDSVPAGSNALEAAGLDDLGNAIQVALDLNGAQTLFFGPAISVTGPTRFAKHVAVTSGLDNLPDGNYLVLFRNVRDEIGNFSDLDGDPSNGYQEFQFGLALW